ncbi:MAG: winged helix-turn-helix domain-containing protein [Candidatus Bathyarchaeia archaeon]
MRRSRLEAYEDILTALAERTRTLDSIAYECKMDCILLSQRLDFLLRNDLIEERSENQKTYYALTRRGSAIFKTLSLTKRLEKLQTEVSAQNEALQPVSTFSQHDEEATRAL